jgi:SAM-dependent methyltransferase
VSAPAPTDGDALRRFYEERYEGAYMTRHQARDDERVRDLLSSIRPETVTSVLDYGCGRGGWAPLLTGLFPDATLHGVEISDAAVAHARRSFPEHEFQAFDGVNAPHVDGQFDLVFSYHVLEHVLDLASTVADMTRLVAPGGHLAAVLPCGDRGSLEERLVRLTGAIERSSTGELRFAYEDPGHLRRVASRDLIELVEQRGPELSEQLFANQFWGGVEVLLAANPSAVRALLDPRKARSVRRRLFVVLVRTALLGAQVLSRVHDLGDRGRPRRRAAARALHPIALTVRPLLHPLFGALDALVAREWQARRHVHGGSAQYLLFRRPTAPNGGRST